MSPVLGLVRGLLLALVAVLFGATSADARPVAHAADAAAVLASFTTDHWTRAPSPSVTDPQGLPDLDGEDQDEIACHVRGDADLAPLALPRAFGSGHGRRGDGRIGPSLFVAGSGLPRGPPGV